MSFNNRDRVTTLEKLLADLAIYKGLLIYHLKLMVT